MNAVMTLLNDKNEHLQKFLQLNEAELINFMNGDFDNLEIFYQSRETILDLIRCIDGLVEVALKDAPAAGTEIAAEDAAGAVLHPRSGAQPVSQPMDDIDEYRRAI